MESKAYIKYNRVSAKKLKPFSKNIVGLTPQDAIDRLTIFGNKTAQILASAIKSALSNAKTGKNMDPMRLKIKTVEVNKGPMFKRFQPVSRGIAHPIKKHTAHIKVVIEERVKNGTKS